MGRFNPYPTKPLEAQMNWLEVTVKTTPEAVEELAERLTDLGAEGVVINDEASIREFLDNNPTAWDYVDDEVFDAYRGETSVQVYLSDDEEGRMKLETFQKALPHHEFTVKTVRDDDWLNNWKQFFKPIEVGERFLIVPEWEAVPETDRVVLRIDPKHIFGNGGHATTRLCLEAAERYPAKTVLDLGCGSGILSIGALLLGADKAMGFEIVPDAPAICRDNCAINNIEDGRLTVFVADVLAKGILEKYVGNTKFDLVFSNVGADFNIALVGIIAPYISPGGVLLCSGIIDTREDEVRRAIESAGLTVLETMREDNWSAFAVRVN
jgi:ribosomal protein L11 methyltransferase